MEDPDDEEHLATCCCCTYRSRSRCVVSICCLMVVMLAITFAVSWYTVVPLVAQSLADKSEISFVHLQLENPINMSVGLTAVANISKMDMPATVNPSRMYQLFNGAVVGHLESSALDVSDKNWTLQNVKGRLTITNETAFDQLTWAILNQDYVQMGIKTTTSITAKKFGLSMTIPGIKIARTLNISGQRGLTDVQVLDFQTRNESKRVFATITVKLFNPSEVSIAPLGDLNMNLMYKGSFLGEGHAKNVTILEGWNTLSLEAELLPENINKSPAAMELFSNYINGVVNHLSAVAPQTGASNFPLFAHAIPGFTMNTSLPPLPAYPAVIEEGNMELSLKMLSDLVLHGKLIMPTTFWLYNPLGATTILTSNNLNVMYKGEAIAYCRTDKDYSGKTLNFAIPPKTHIISPQLPVTSVFSDHFKAYSAAVGDLVKNGYICLGASGTMDLMIGDVAVTTKYEAPETVLTCQSIISSVCKKFIDGGVNPCIPKAN